MRVNICAHTHALRTVVFTTDTFTDIFMIVLLALCVLGALICVVCLVYFRQSMALCGYALLTGLLLVFALAVVYALPANAGLCVARRIGTGCVWMLVFAPCLIQAMHSWWQQMRARRESDSKPLPPPPAWTMLLVTLALVGVQLVCTVEWVVLVRSRECREGAHTHRTG